MIELHEIAINKGKITYSKDYVIINPDLIEIIRTIQYEDHKITEIQMNSKRVIRVKETKKELRIMLEHEGKERKTKYKFIHED